MNTIIWPLKKGLGVPTLMTADWTNRHYSCSFSMKAGGIKFLYGAATIQTLSPLCVLLKWNFNIGRIWSWVRDDFIRCTEMIHLDTVQCIWWGEPRFTKTHGGITFVRCYWNSVVFYCYQLAWLPIWNKQMKMSKRGNILNEIHCFPILHNSNIACVIHVQKIDCAAFEKANPNSI